MRYNGGRSIRVGDKVIADGMPGIVICDYDHDECLQGYENLLASSQQYSEDLPSTGVMIKTEQAGLLFYSEDDPDVVLIETSTNL